MCGIVCTIQDITSSVYELRPPYLCHHTHYIWHHVHIICVITFTVLMLSQQLYFWDHISYNSRHHIHCTRHDSHCMTSQPLHSLHQIPYIWNHCHGLWLLLSYTCDITDTMFVNRCQLYLTSNTRFKTIQPLYVKSQSPYVYLCDDTHCIDDITHTVFMAHCALYMTSQPWFITSQHSTHYISLLYLISNWLYLTAHPLYLCHHTQIIDHITPTVCMITQAQYVWYHMNTYDITSTIKDITPHYGIHTHCIHIITPRIPVIASTVAELFLTVYWL